MVLNLDEKRFLFLFPLIQYRQLLGNIKMSTVKIAITASSTSKGQRERESKKISCNCFNARLDRESCYSSFRLSNSRAPDFELLLILSPPLTNMYVHPLWLLISQTWSRNFSQQLSFFRHNSPHKKAKSITFVT